VSVTRQSASMEPPPEGVQAECAGQM
jgi:hypothetical protein